jgi:hypothetical protein
MPRPLFTTAKEPVLFVQEDVWAPGPVWTVAEYLGLTGIRSQDRTARSLSLYRLSYQAHKGIAIPLQGSKNLRLPDFKTIGT